MKTRTKTIKVYNNKGNHKLIITSELRPGVLLMDKIIKKEIRCHGTD